MLFYFVIHAVNGDCVVFGVDFGFGAQSDPAVDAYSAFLYELSRVTA